MMGARAALAQRRISQRAGAQRLDRMKARQYKQRARASRVRRQKPNIHKPTGGYRPAPVQQPRYSPPAATASGRYARPRQVPAQAAGRVRQVRRAPKPPPKPKPPAIGKFLGTDVTYQDQLRNYARSLSQLQGDITRRRGTLGEDFRESQRAAGQQKTRDLESIEEDYASRGLLRSGLYGGAVGEYEEEFGERMSDLERRQQRALTALKGELSKFKGEQRLKKQSARESAIRRRAEKFGLE